MKTWLGPIVLITDPYSKRSTITAWVIMLIAGIMYVSGQGDRSKGLSPEPELQWMAFVFFIIALAIYVIGIVVRGRLERDRKQRSLHTKTP